MLQDNKCKLNDVDDAMVDFVEVSSIRVKKIRNHIFSFR